MKVRLALLGVFVMSTLHSQDLTFNPAEFPTRPTYVSQPNNFSGTVGDPPPPTPTPTPTPNPPPTPTPPYQTPTPPPTAPPSHTPPTTPPPQPYPPSGADGNVHVTNASDIYQPIVDAIKGIGESPVTAPTINSGFETGQQPDPISNDQSLAIKDGLTEAQGKLNDTLASGKTKIEAIEPLTLPSAGSKSSWNITLPMLGAMTISLEPYLGVIGFLRALILMVMAISAWFASIRIIRSGIA